MHQNVRATENQNTKELVAVNEMERVTWHPPLA